MAELSPSRLLSRLLGAALVLIGLAVFAIRLQHAGTYDPPEGGNLLGGLLALAAGSVLLFDGFATERSPRPIVWIALGVSPIALFLALYATLAEVEEVVVIDAHDHHGRSVALRLWIVDRADGAWITMPASKAEAHGLGRGPIELLRDGSWQCRMATRHDDRSIVDAIHRLRHERYFVQRLATAVGLFDRDAKPTTIALQLTPCRGPARPLRAERKPVPISEP